MRNVPGITMFEPAEIIATNLFALPILLLLTNISRTSAIA
ncbi:hypothetical protein SAMN02982922_0103 [Mesorhizobium australicum]|uniref:Uncharacterized protein n=1 Tax=Mesorhizobium australicum TaxID=536018 RepID=A0A1X7MN70_9HYPH|nr:hypothetical protein SAMN02982922_0103 [Mesorhizobium australicum]